MEKGCLMDRQSGTIVLIDWLWQFVYEQSVTFRVWTEWMDKTWLMFDGQTMNIGRWMECDICVSTMNVGWIER